METPSLFLFVALECEARPLIRFFNLKKVQLSQAFSLYKANEIVLTVTGVGKVAMAGGVAYTLALFPSVTLPIMINVGVAGAKDANLGNLFLASKVTDNESNACFYPQLVVNHLPPVMLLKTSCHVVSHYQTACLHDMEASGFYEMAIKFSSSELIHCLKIISDNEQSAIELINAKQVSQWIEQQIEQIESFLNQLIPLRLLIKPVQPEGYESLISQWHFTVSGKLKLQALLRRWQILNGNKVWSFEEISNQCRTGKDVLKQLEQQLERCNIVL